MKRRIITAATTAAAGLLALGMSAAPAGAAITPDTLTTCSTGSNNSYEYITWCAGTGPTSYRAVALCMTGEVVLGVELADGKQSSHASCQVDGMNSTLNTDWGILLCSNYNGTGTYAGYENRHYDISQFLQNWGNGNIAAGGTWACDFDTNAAVAVSATQPQLSHR
jgi:hypothetical protein